MDFNKYCNCYSKPYDNIYAECHDTVLEAIYTHESRPHDDRVDSRLVIMKRFWPVFIQKIIVHNALNKKVVFVSPKLSLDINKNNE